MLARFQPCTLLRLCCFSSCSDSSTIVFLHSNKRPKIVPCIKLCRKCLANEKFWNPSENEVSSKSDPEVNKWFLDLIATPPSILMCWCGVCCWWGHWYWSTWELSLSSLPMTKSIEDAPSRLYTLYQGTGLLIVSLLAYNILLNPASFSIPKTLERLAKRLHLPESINYWVTRRSVQKSTGRSLPEGS